MVKINLFSFKKKLRNINHGWQNQDWYEILFHIAIADPSRVSETGKQISFIVLSFGLLK